MAETTEDQDLIKEEITIIVSVLGVKCMTERDHDSILLSSLLLLLEWNKHSSKLKDVIISCKKGYHHARVSTEEKMVINLNMEHNLLTGFTIVAVSIVGTVVLYE